MNRFTTSARAIFGIALLCVQTSVLHAQTVARGKAAPSLRQAAGIKNTPGAVKNAPVVIHGVCYDTYQTPYTFLTTGSDDQLRRLKKAGMNYVSLRVKWAQEAYNTWDIAPNFATPTDEAIAHVVRVCHELDMKVSISLMVTLTTYRNPDDWWGDMKPGDGLKDPVGNAIDPAEGWRRWFDSYEEFLLHYARLSEQCGADMLAIGNEFMTATTHEREWREMIAHTRQVYRGKLTYQAFIAEFSAIRFWDALDYIGINPYWVLSQSPDPGMPELVASLEKAREEMMIWYNGMDAAARKPIVFTEAGYYSADGTAIHPWESNTANRKRITNTQLQVRCIEAFLQVFGREPSGAGIFWWVECPPGEPGVDNNGAGFPFLGKPAEAVLKRFSAELQAGPRLVPGPVSNGNGEADRRAELKK